MLIENIFNPKKQVHFSEQNLYSIENFRQRLAFEKRRSERVNSKLSIILFNVKNFLIFNADHKKSDFGSLIQIICSNVRALDVVSAIKYQTILILLPDTDNIGAKSVCHKLVKRIMDKYAPDQNLTVNDFFLKIITYPDKQILDTDLDTILQDHRITDFSGNPTAQQFNNDVKFENEYLKNLNLNVNSVNDSAISISYSDSFPGLHELISKYVLSVKLLMKRIIDLIGSIVAIVLFSALMLIIALSVKFSSPGPIFFKQKRVGYKGKCFTFIKFRSMYNNNNQMIHRDYVSKLIKGEKDRVNEGTNDNPFYKLKDDPRITPLGQFLRKTSLDELPQFFNVLKGEMSLVGPRPPIPYEVNKYQNWHFRRIIEVKPGITGLWQVSGRSRTTFDDMVRLDIEYAENWSLMMDIKILFKTFWTIFTSKGV